MAPEQGDLVPAKVRQAVLELQGRLTEGVPLLSAGQARLAQ